jgi:hypothetical protein
MLCPVVFLKSGTGAIFGSGEIGDGSEFKKSGTFSGIESPLPDRLPRRLHRQEHMEPIIRQAAEPKPGVERSRWGNRGRERLWPVSRPLLHYLRSRIEAMASDAKPP